MTDWFLFLVILNVVTTLFMTGVIWFVQTVHYPLFALIGPREFIRYETSHKHLTTLIAGPVMLIELMSALSLVVTAGTTYAPIFSWCGLILLLLIWLSTTLVQVPLHNQLSVAHCEMVCKRLVSSNWLRTVLWSARAVLMVTLVSLLVLGVE